MRLFRRPRTPVTYPAILLRISTLDGVILEIDSTELHCDGVQHYGNGWFDLIAGGHDGAMEFSTVPLKIEVKPISLIVAPG